MTKKRNIPTKLSIYSVPNVTRPRLSETMIDGKEWMSYGADNLFPDFLWSLYCDSPTHQAIIDSKVLYTMGAGLSIGKEKANRKETVSEVIRKCVLDFQLFGGFAIQVVRDANGDIAEIWWADFAKLRTNKDGSMVFWSDDWRSWNVEPKAFPVYDPESKNPTEIFYYRGATCRSVYPVCCYMSAIDSIQTEVEVQHWHLNNIKNNFASNHIINILGAIPDEEERKETEKLINEKFTGSDVAGRLLINWAETKDEKMTVDTLGEDSSDKKFMQLAKDVNEKITIAHRVTSAILIGRVAESGFSRLEFQQAFEIFNTTVIKPIQDEISMCLSKIFPEKEIHFDPFVLPTEKSENPTM